VVTPHDGSRTNGWGHTVGFNSSRDQWMKRGFLPDMSASLLPQAFVEKETPKKFRRFLERREAQLLLGARTRRGLFAAIDVGPLDHGVPRP